MTTYAIDWGDGTSIRIGSSRAYAERLLREASGPFLAKNPAPRVVEVSDPTPSTEEQLMTTTPTPAEFMLLPTDPDDDFDHEPAPVEPRLADLERRVTALERGKPLTPERVARIFDVPADIVALPADTAREELVDLEAKHQVVLELVETIGGIVKKSTSKVSLEVKAAIDAWANPQMADVDEASDTPEQVCVQCGATFPDVVALQAHGTRTHGADFDYRDGGEGLQPEPGQPAHDAPVEEWRAYAAERLKGLGYEGDLAQMNRSQIRTLLGIEQLAGA